MLVVKGLRAKLLERWHSIRPSDVGPRLGGRKQAFFGPSLMAGASSGMRAGDPMMTLPCCEASMHACTLCLHHVLEQRTGHEST